MGRFTIILIAIAIAVSGEGLAAGLLLLGFEVGLALGNPKPKSEPEPDCLGTYPFLNYQDQAERDCGSCSFAQDCYEETPFPYPRANRQ